MLELFDIAYDEVEIIKELWEKNRKYHEESSQYFKESYQNLEFHDRISAFSSFDSKNIKITVAEDNGRYIGYCLSTIIDGKGELESLHVDESCRGSGVGKKLVIAHLDWFRENECKVIGVTVSQENEATIGFYRSLGFYPNTIYMQQK